MPWSAPATVVTGDIITAAWGNTYVRDNTAYLMGLLDGTGSGPIIVPGAVRTGNRGTAWGRSATQTVLAHNTADVGNRLNTGSPGALIQINEDGSVQFYAFPAGANPIATFNLLLQMDAAGKLTGVGYYSSGEVSIANATTSTLSHGLSGRPRLVAGYYNSASTSEDGKAFPIMVGESGMATTFSGLVIKRVSNTQIDVENRAGATRYAHIYAIL